MRNIFESPLLQDAITKGTGLKESEVKQKLLSMMDRESYKYKKVTGSNSCKPDSWAAITAAYDNDDPIFYIDLLKAEK